MISNAVLHRVASHQQRWSKAREDRMPPLLMAALVAATPEIEILEGYLAGGTNDPRAVALSVRGGVDISDQLTLSGMFIGIPGPKAQYASGSYAGQVDPSGMQASSSLPDIR